MREQTTPKRGNKGQLWVLDIGVSVGPRASVKGDQGTCNRRCIKEGGTRLKTKGPRDENTN